MADNRPVWRTMADMDNDTRTVLRLPDQLLQRVRELAHAESRSTAAMMRLLVTEALEARSAKR